MTKKWLFWLIIAVLFFVFLYLIRNILLPFVVGIFAAYFLDPAADRLEKNGMSRALATTVITAGFFMVLLLLFLWIPPLVIDQLSGLLEALPEYANAVSQQYGDKFASWFGGLPAVHMENLRQAVTDVSGIALKFAGDFVTGIFQSGVVVVNLLSLLLITPVVAFYLLRDWDYIVSRINHMLPKAHAATIRAQMAIINQTLAGFVRGQLNVCLLLGIYYAIGLSFLGLKFGAIIGIVTGFLVILPYVGLLFGSFIGLAVAFFQYDSYAMILGVLAVFVSGQVIESNFVTPKLVGDKVNLHPLWIIFGMLAGGTLFGFVGILLAIPVTAVIGVLARFAIGQYLESEYYTGGYAKK